MQATSLALIVALTGGLAGTAGATSPDCGTVTGSISVEMATVRTDGPKHDRDVVVMLEPVGSEAPAATETSNTSRRAMATAATHRHSTRNAAFLRMRPETDRRV